MWCKYKQYTCNSITSAFSIGIIPLFKSNFLSSMFFAFSLLLNRTKIHEDIVLCFTQ